VAKTSGIILEQVRDKLARDFQVLALAPTRVARSQLSSVLLPWCKDFKYVAEVWGSKALTPLEKKFTREARLKLS
jgi:hypothetical protein